MFLHYIETCSYSEGLCIVYEYFHSFPLLLLPQNSFWLKNRSNPLTEVCPSGHLVAIMWNSLPCISFHLTKSVLKWNNRNQNYIVSIGIELGIGSEIKPAVSRIAARSKRSLFFFFFLQTLGFKNLKEHWMFEALSLWACKTNQKTFFSPTVAQRKAVRTDKRSAGTETSGLPSISSSINIWLGQMPASIDISLAAR